MGVSWVEGWCKLGLGFVECGHRVAVSWVLGLVYVGFEVGIRWV